MDGRRPAFGRVHRTRPTGRLARRPLCRARVAVRRGSTAWITEYLELNDRRSLPTRAYADVNNDGCAAGAHIHVVVGIFIRAYASWMITVQHGFQDALNAESERLRAGSGAKMKQRRSSGSVVRACASFQSSARQVFTGRVIQQGQQREADVVGGGLVADDENGAGQVGELFLGQAVAGVARRDEGA
jgi:hypothetical protein